MISDNSLTLHYESSTKVEDFFAELKLIISKDNLYPIEICFPSDFKIEQLKPHIFELANYLIAKKKCSTIKLSGLTGIEFYNQLLVDIAQFNKRNSILFDKNDTTAEKLLQTLDLNEKKPDRLRRAKKQLIDGEKIQVSLQQQNQHVQIQQQVQEQQQQIQQQQSQQQKLEQQQERVKAYQQTDCSIDSNLMGEILSIEDISKFAEQKKLEYSFVLTCWEDLVGSLEVTRSIDNIRNKITHVSRMAFEKVIQYKHEFKSGVHPENLPNGFAIKYDCFGKYSILFYHKTLEKKPDDPDYRCNPLTISLIPELPIPTLSGSSVGQFFHFTEENKTLETDYQKFTKSYQEIFNSVFNYDKNTVVIGKLIQPCLKLIKLVAENEQIKIQPEIIKLIEKTLNEFSLDEFNAFRWIIQKKGALGVLQWFELVQKLQRSDVYHVFKSVFLKHSADYSQFLDVDCKIIIQELCQLDSWKKQWWLRLTQQHIDVTGKADLKRLWFGFDYFIKETEKKLKLALPDECQVKNNQHMLLFLDRLLFILNHAIDPAEQAEYLDNLDYSAHGAVCAFRTDNYYLVTEEMEITRGSITDNFKLLYSDEFQKKVDEQQYANFLQQKPATEEERCKVIEAFIQLNKDDIQLGKYGPIPNIKYYARVYKPSEFVSFAAKAGKWVHAKMDSVEKVMKPIQEKIEKLDEEIFNDRIRYAEERLLRVETKNIPDEYKEEKKYKWQRRIRNIKYEQEDHRLRSTESNESRKKKRAPLEYLAKGVIFHLIVIARVNNRWYKINHHQINLDDPGYVISKWDYVAKEKWLGSCLEENNTTDQFKINLKELLQCLHQSIDQKQLAKIKYYFFRYIGRQTERFPFATYQLLFKKLQNRISHDVKLMGFIPLLAAATTGRRALALCLPEFAFENLCNYFFQKDTYIQLQYLKILTECLSILTVAPSLEDLVSLLRFVDESCNGLRDILHKASYGYGDCPDFLYDFMLRADKRYQAHKNDWHFYYSAWENFKDLLEAISCNNLLIKDLNCGAKWRIRKLSMAQANLLGQLVIIKHAESRNDIGMFDIAPLMKELSDKKINTLLEFFKTVNFAATTQYATTQEIISLLKAIVPLAENAKLKVDIESLVIQHLPSIIFQQIEVADHLSIIINYIQTFTPHLLECKKQINEFYPKIKKMLIDEEQSKELENITSTFDLNEVPYLSKIPGINFTKNTIANFLFDKKEKLLTAIDSIKNKLEEKFDAMMAALQKNEIKVFFDQIDAFVKLLEDPFVVLESSSIFSNLSYMDQATLWAVKKAFGLVFNKVKNLVEGRLKEALEPTISALLAHPIAKIGLGYEGIKREHLEEFKKSLLNFLKTEIMQLKHDSFAQQVNQQLRAAEQAELFINIFVKLSKDKLQPIISVLQQNQYFKDPKDSKKSSDNLIKPIGKIIHAISSLKAVDAEKTIVTLLDKLTVKNCEIRLAAIDAIKNQNEREILTGEAFSALLEMGVAQQTNKRDLVLEICHFGAIKNPDITLLAKNATEEELKEILSWLKQKKPTDLIATLIVHHLAKDTKDHSSLLKLIQALDQIEVCKLSHLHPIIKAMQKQAVSVDDQIWLLQQLNMKSTAELKTLAALYEKEPCPDYDRLKLALNNKENIIEFANQYDQDPFGRRHKIPYNYSYLEIQKFTRQIVELDTDKEISEKMQQLLYQQFTYIMVISKQYGLALIKENGVQWKPLKNFTREELASYAPYLRSEFANAKEMEKETLYLQIIALLMEVFFRIYGQAPSPNQVLSILVYLNQPGNLVLQIDPGQGKTMPLAILLGLAYLTGYFVNFSSRDDTLVNREYNSFKAMASFLSIPVGTVTAETEKNIYAEKNRQITFATPSNFVHYVSAQTISKANSFVLPKKNKLINFCDEADFFLLDYYQTSLNYAVTDGNPYNNPNEEFYFLINEFVNSDLFIKPQQPNSLQPKEREDINNLRQYLAQKTVNYKRYEKELTNAVLNQWINSACAAKQSIEEEAFVVNSIKRDEYGEEKVRSIATILTNGMKDPQASWGKGIQQCLHARLNKSYEKEIKDDKLKPFSCDAESKVLDSKIINHFFGLHGRLILFTGTPGSKLERQEIKQTYQCTFLKLPRRFDNLLKIEDTIFAANEENLLWKVPAYYKAIVARLRNRDSIKDNGILLKQPSVIFVAGIKDAEEMNRELKLRLTTQDYAQINMHHPNSTVSFSLDGEKDLRQQYGEVEAKNIIIERAGQPNTITIVTGDEFGIGTNIKKVHQLLAVLVIIADLFRERKVIQYQCRTARADEKGTTVTIYNVEKIAAKYGIEVDKRWWRSGQISLITELQCRLDQEAQVERVYTTKLAEIHDVYSRCYDVLLKKSPDGNELIKRCKADFISESQRLWEEILIESDPTAKYANPYIRYENGKLLPSPLALEQAVENYRQQIKELFAESTKVLPALKDSQEQVEESEKIDLPKPIILNETHANLLYRHYQDQLSDRFNQEPYVIRTKFLVQLMSSAKNAGQITLFNEYHDKLLALDEHNQCYPLIKSVTDIELLDKQMLWMSFVKEALSTQNSKQVRFLTELDCEPIIIKNSILALMPTKSAKQQLLKEQLSAEFAESADLVAINQSLSQYLADAHREEIFSDEETKSLDYLAEIVSHLTRHVAVYKKEKNTKTSSCELVAKPEFMKLANKIKVQWRESIDQNNNTILMPDDIDKNFSSLASLIRVDLKIHSDTQKGFENQFSNWLVNQVNQIKIDGSGSDGYNKTMFQRFAQIDTGKKFLNQLISLQEIPIFSLIIANIIASQFFINQYISDDNLQQLSTLILIISKLEKIDTEEVVPSLLKDVSKENVKARVKIAEELLKANQQTTIIGKVFNTSLTLLLKGDDKKYQCFITLFRTKGLDFDLIHHAIDKLPVETLILIENWCSNDYPIELLNNLMARYLTVDPPKISDFKKHIESFNGMAPTMFTDLFCIIAELENDVEYQVLILYACKTLNAEDLNNLRHFSHLSLLIKSLKDCPLFKERDALHKNAQQIITFFADISRLNVVDPVSIISLLLQDFSIEKLKINSDKIKTLIEANRNGIKGEALLVALKLLLSARDNIYLCFIDLAKVEGLSFKLLCPAAEKLSHETLLLIQDWVKGNKSIRLLNKLIQNHLAVSPFDEKGFVKQLKNGVLPGIQGLVEFAGERNQLINQVKNITRIIEAEVAKPSFEVFDQTTEQIIFSDAIKFLADKLMLYADASTDDAKILESLSIYLQSCRERGFLTQLTDFNSIVIKAINLTAKKIVSPQCQQYLSEVKDYVNAVSLLGDNKPTDSNKVNNEFRLMVWQIKELLQKTLGRVSERSKWSYLWLHFYAGEKTYCIKSFLDTYCTDSAINQFLEKNTQGQPSTKPQDLLTAFMNQSVRSNNQNLNLKEILSINTRRGHGSSTTSSAELDVLISRIKEEMDSINPNSDQAANAIGDQYIARLHDIKKDLHQRAIAASPTFKDVAAYNIKDSRLDGYIEQTVANIKKKQGKQITDIESEIRRLKQRIENDPAVNRNTSKFNFFSSRNTLMTDISATTDEFLRRIQRRNA